MAVHHNLPHWNYFRLLEGDLEKCFQYVQPDSQHFGVFSGQFVRIILVSSTEIENCLRALAIKTARAATSKDIKGYYSAVIDTYPRFTETRLFVPRYSLTIDPWKDWTDQTGPDWWSKGYNKIKHDRVGHPDAPTLFRAISSVGALLVLLLHFYRLNDKHAMMPSEIEPRLFALGEDDEGFEGASICWSWVLPDERRNSNTP